MEKKLTEKAITSLVDLFNFWLALADFLKFIFVKSALIPAENFFQKEQTENVLACSCDRLSMKTLQRFQKLPHARLEIGT